VLDLMATAHIHTMKRYGRALASRAMKCGGSVMA
jgi:hypothetical protein